VKLRNINGTSDNTCKCGSWLAHWKKYSGQVITYCPVSGCLERELLGAHVQKDDETDKKWYILPLCQDHNAKIDSLTVTDGLALVNANVSETCGKTR